MNEVVTLEPWSPWPLVFPVAVVLAGAAVSIAGTRRRSKPLRETGYVAIVFGALAAAAMTYSMSGIWDTQQRTDALVSLGYETPTFSGGTSLAGGELPPVAFQAVRDGTRVRGVIVQVEGDRWEVREIDEDDDAER
ncbi:MULTISPECIES: hypothetical protein [unclassified Agromyces]|uniref:hypothetical protein n=1 Tax=unclassified Agromyces TaxID=2639701 RepID=UPI00301558EE